MEKMSLSFGTLMADLNRAISEMPDPRKPSNNQHYSLKDLVLGAFSVFFMQCESFLEHQHRMQSAQGENNAARLFGLTALPTVPQIRNVLDTIPSVRLSEVFNWVYQTLRQAGWLKPYEVLGGHLLVALDGTQYFSSHSIHCAQCSHKQHSNGTVSYSHTVILPVIVAPGQSEVISLAPEFITPQDGQEKQDCEVNAAKRWIQRHATELQGQRVTLLGDDLYSHQPMCEAVLAAGMNFIFTCLPTSHPLLDEWLTSLEHFGEVRHVDVDYRHLKTHEVYRYRYVNAVPLRDSAPSLLVNWCEMQRIRVKDGTVLYHNSWVTRHDLDDQSVALVVAAGRGRWKTENENHNTLKTKGYHLEHNFGHGKQHLSTTLLTLNVLAFLFHTVLQLVDECDQAMRQKRGTRKGFFQDICSLTKYLLFESWQGLIDFMLDGESTPKTVNSS
jgi:hypothetical protein